MDFYQFSTKNPPGYEIAGVAKTIRKNSAGKYLSMQPEERDIYEWMYGEVWINDYYMDGFSNKERELVIVHEMLHVFGSKDMYKPTSILHYSMDNIRYNGVNGVTSDANNMLKSKYQ